MRVLSENTLMPLSLVVGAGGIIFWAASLAVRVSANEADLEEYKAVRAQMDLNISRRDEQREQLQLELLRRVERIDTRVDYIYEAIKRSPPKD